MGWWSNSSWSDIWSRLEVSKRQRRGRFKTSQTSPYCYQRIDQTGSAQNPSAAGFDEEDDGLDDRCTGRYGRIQTWVQRVKDWILTYGSFVGPGFMVAVAYIDPGNYATGIAAGASYRFSLLFVIFLSNVFAVFLQSLAIKLGTVSGLNLAEACRAFLPPWLNYGLYALAEAAIIATDIAEVIGTAIALNMLVPAIPLTVGCIMSAFDVMVILLFYRPNGGMRGMRLFEYFVMFLVLSVFACFCIELALIPDTSAGEVLRGYLPSGIIVEQRALYQACGIMGATVMPHSLYLGSGMVQARLREYDDARALQWPPPEIDEEEDAQWRVGGVQPPRQNAHVPPSTTSTTSATTTTTTTDERVNYGLSSLYKPSLAAIQYCLQLSVAETAVSLLSIALFINSAILIVAGASLFGDSAAMNADIFEIYNLLCRTISPAAGFVFALALLLSGVSAGIVCTIAGQIVSEGALNWTLKPWLRRLVTRAISIVPSVIIAAAVGRSGIDQALEASQVALSITLPFLTAPLIYFTSRDHFMTVRKTKLQQQHERDRGTTDDDGGDDTDDSIGRLALSLADHSSSRLEYRCRDSSQTVCDANRELQDGGIGNDQQDHQIVRFTNSWATTGFALIIWVIMVAMNFANLVLMGA